MNCICGNYKERKIRLNLYLVNKKMLVCLNCGRLPPIVERRINLTHRTIPIEEFASLCREDKIQSWQEVAHEMLEEYRQEAKNAYKATNYYQQSLGRLDAMQTFIDKCGIMK